MLITGDTHGEQGRFYEILSQAKRDDIIIVTGDF